MDFRLNAIFVSPVISAGMCASMQHSVNWHTVSSFNKSRLYSDIAAPPAITLSEIGSKRLCTKSQNVKIVNKEKIRQTEVRGIV